MARKNASSSETIGNIAGARAASLPSFVEPELATLVKDPPVGDSWLHEMKLDGYRILCRVDDGKAKLYSRNRNDWTPLRVEVTMPLMVVAFDRGDGNS